MSEGASLYEVDFVRWSEEQAAAIRGASLSGTNLPLDWQNLAEEIESLGRSVRSELRSRLATVIEHLMKLQHSPSSEPRRGWIEKIIRERNEINELLAENPSLRQAVPGLIERATPKCSELAAIGLEQFGELSPVIRGRLEAARYGTSEVTGAWLPSAPNEGAAH